MSKIITPNSPLKIFLLCFVLLVSVSYISPFFGRGEGVVLRVEKRRRKRKSGICSTFKRKGRISYESGDG